MSQKLPNSCFKRVKSTSKLTNDFIENCNDDSEKYLQYPEILYDLPNDLHFLPERMKSWKVEKFVTHLYDRKEYVIHIRKLKQELNHGLVLKKKHRVFKFNKAWLKLNMNIELRKNAKNDFEKDFSSWWIMSFLKKLWKICENIEISSL